MKKSDPPVTILGLGPTVQTILVTIPPTSDLLHKIRLLVKGELTALDDGTTKAMKKHNKALQRMYSIRSSC